jgi:hypothetical protein
VFNEDEMKFVPAYNAANGKGQSVPFIVSLMMVDDENKAALPPAVSASIDRTLSITGTEGVAFANIYNVEPHRPGDEDSRRTCAVPLPES